MQNGFITLHRKIQDHWVYQNPFLFHLFMHLLLNANHEEREFLLNGEITQVKRGQFITGRKVLAATLHQSEARIYRNLTLLERSGLITLKSNNKYSLITIIKYSDYQSKKEILDNKRTTDEQQMNTNNNVNNDNNVNNKQYTAALIEKLWDKFTNNPLYKSIVEKYPDRDYKFYFLEMCDWYQTKKNKLPQNISALTKWLSRTYPDEALKAERLRALDKEEKDKKQQEILNTPQASPEKLVEIREKMKLIGK